MLARAAFRLCDPRGEGRVTAAGLRELEAALADPRSPASGPSLAKHAGKAKK